MAHVYIESHYFDLNVTDTSKHQYKRSPEGKQTLWLACEDGVSHMKVLKTLRALLDEDDKNILVDARFSEDSAESCKNYCKMYDWTFVDNSASYFGYESDVCKNL